MLTHFATQEIAYTGAELRRGWLRAAFGLEGDAIAAFIGPCDVAPEHMVDLEDRAAGAKIYSRRMLHFIAEHADPHLERAALRQRLLVAIALECIHRQSGRVEVRRQGNDLFWQGRKLSVSVATTSPTSGLIHLGLNIVAQGAPVAAADLTELGVEPRRLGQDVMAAYAAEMGSVAAAQRKVRAVE
jgi:hypothetical protein